MEVEWHLIKTKKDLPPVNKRVLVTVGRFVDVDRRYAGEGFSGFWKADVVAWAELPKPYKKPKK
jgi:hypothetical protein